MRMDGISLEFEGFVGFLGSVGGQGGIETKRLRECVVARALNAAMVNFGRSRTRVDG